MKTEIKKIHFEEKYEKFSYEFIETSELPERELSTCVFAMLSFEGKIYLTKNHRGWELPGGHIESLENFDEALDREIAEEIGTKIKTKKFFGYKKYTNFKKTPNREGGFYPFPNSYILLYIGEATGEDFKIDCPDTIDYGLFKIDEALKKVDSNGVRKIIEIVSGRNI